MDEHDVWDVGPKRRKERHRVYLIDDHVEPSRQLAPIPPVGQPMDSPLSARTNELNPVNRLLAGRAWKCLTEPLDRVACLDQPPCNFQGQCFCPTRARVLRTPPVQDQDSQVQAPAPTLSW